MAAKDPNERRPDPGSISAKALESLVWQQRLTHLGLWAERISQAFWPLWVVLLLVFSATAFGLWQQGSLLQLRIGLGLTGLAALFALGFGLWRFRRPRSAEARSRLDASLPGRPISALLDAQAIGAGDAGSETLWRVHQQRMAARLAGARPVAPDLRLSSRDPYSLRYVALTAAVMAALFGSFWRAAEMGALGGGPAQAMPHGPAWEGWARPPAYTGQPTLYLNDIPAGELQLPVGSRIQLRLYGEEGAASVEQSIAQVAAPETAADAGADAATGASASPAALPEGLAALSELQVSQSGRLAITGPGGREWQVIATPDLVPEIAISGDMGREADGRFKQGFVASDDYGVTAAEVVIRLDPSKVIRRYGLEIAPEEIAPVTLDLPMPKRGNRTGFSEILRDDLSAHLFANMPVVMEFAALDAAGNRGVAQPYAVILPGKRFFDPAAAAVAELRRDLLWNRENLPRSLQLLKAIGHRPEGLRAQNAAKRLRVLLRSAENLAQPLSDADRDLVADELWEIAFMFEEGDLGSAYDRLQRAQERLEEAMKNGASPEEIEELMDELQQAMRDYMRELGQQPQDPSQGGSGESREVTQDQIQKLLDEIERLMKEGKTAEAMELMEQLRALMENLQMSQGQGGEGEGEGQGGEGAMRELGDTLRDQQGLSDDAYRDMQRGRSGRNGRNGSGENSGSGEGQGGSEGDQPDDLAERQEELRRKLEELQEGDLPGSGSEQGEAARDRLGEAEEAMREAEEALREGDLSGALDRQAEAMRALREGMQDLGEALAQENRQPGAEGGDRAQRDARRVDPNATDPLGREPGDSARIGSDRNMVENAPDQRARDLLDEIRRRSAELARPEAELDYLRRLLDLF